MYTVSVLHMPMCGVDDDVVEPGDEVRVVGRSDDVWACFDWDWDACNEAPWAMPGSCLLYTSPSPRDS